MPNREPPTCPKCQRTSTLVFIKADAKTIYYGCQACRLAFRVHTAKPKPKVEEPVRFTKEEQNRLQFFHKLFRERGLIVDRPEPAVAA